MFTKIILNSTQSYCTLRSIRLLNKTINNCFINKIGLHLSINCLSNVSKTDDTKGDNIYNVVKYTTSDAHLKHKAYQNFRFSDEEVMDTPVYERPILVISSALFFLWFGYLREPNDLDEKMSSNLFDLVPGLEVPMIEQAIKNAESLGSDTRALRERLAELKDLKKRVENIEKTKK